MDSHMLLNIDQYLIVRPYEFGETMSKIFDLCAHVDVSDPSVELISMKRLMTVERNASVLYPVVDLALIDGTCENRKHFDEINSLTTGVFRLVQGLDPRLANGLLKIDSRSMGYLFFIFKTMEDMGSRAFLSQWKTWTGARLFRNALNPEIPMGRISFFRKASGALDFEFLLLVKMPTFKQHAAPILNALNLVRPRVNAFVGCYIDENFQVNASLGGRLFSRQLQELSSENEHIDDLIEATTLRIRFNNNSAKLEVDGLVAGGECILKKIETNVEIVDENANFPPPEPAPALFLKRTGATQTDSEEDQQNKHISTQTEPLPPVEKPLKVDKENSPMSGGDSRRHSLHSIPRTTAVHDFSTLFRDDSFLNVPKNIMGEKKRLSNPRFNSQTHVHFCDENENWQKLSDELDGHLRAMIRRSRRRSSSTIRKAGEDRDQFLKQLRERYFNSPDYHRDERMAEYRTVVIVNNT